MSLRNYLFILIGGLITLLTIIQLAVVFWIEQNLEQEVDNKARLYSERIVELAIDRLQPEQALQKAFNESAAKIAEKYKHSIDNAKQLNQTTVETIDQSVKLTAESNEPQHAVKFYSFSNDHVITLTTDDENNLLNEVIVKGEITPEIEEKVKISKKLLKKEFKSIVKTLHQENKPRVIKTDHNTQVILEPPMFIKTSWSEQRSKHSQALFDKIQLMIIAVAIIGLLFAFWLSAKFNKPLKELSQGFTKLAERNEHPQVKVQGVKEIRNTIEHFNQMVERLAKLSAQEKQHKEIAHLAELGEVSRGLAHALRNPIHTIGLSIEELQDDNLPESYRTKLLDTVRDKISHLDKNIKALLTLTTTGISRTDKVPLLAVVQDIILEYKSSVNNPIEFELNIDENLQLLAAESEVRSIIHTLIYNACEASEANAKVVISAKSIAGKIELHVIDSGQGLDQHIEKQLFQPHVSSKSEGAGMGLYIAKRLITLHYNGNIEIKNNDQHGCTATASFGATTND